MLIQSLLNNINKKCGNELLTYSQCMVHLDAVIDDINNALDSTYPAFSELPTGTREYTAFPDKWLRQVVVPGVAWYFYVADEEGEEVAMQYQRDYKTALFYMTRDMLYNIPVQYQSKTINGVVLAPEAVDNNSGVTVDGNYFRL